MKGRLKRCRNCRNALLAIKVFFNAPLSSGQLRYLALACKRKRLAAEFLIDAHLFEALAFHQLVNKIVDHQPDGKL